jgi:hypothetical protein
VVDRIMRALLWWITPWWAWWLRDPMRGAREHEHDSDIRLKTLALTEIELARDGARRP